MCQAGIIAALYVALTYLSMSMGLDKYAVQVRFSEALCVIAFFTSSAVPGLWGGCLLANILTGCAPLDIALGPIATLVGAFCAYTFGRIGNRRVTRWLCTLPNVLANTVIVPFVVYICYTAPSEQSWQIIPFYAITVGLGELVSSTLIGTALLIALEKRADKIFRV